MSSAVHRRSRPPERREVLPGNVSDHHGFGIEPKIEPQKHRIPDRHILDELEPRLPRSPMPECEPAEAILTGPGRTGRWSTADWCRGCRRAFCQYRAHARLVDYPGRRP